MSSSHPASKSPGTAHLSVAVVSPDRRRRIAAVQALAQSAGVRAREIDAYATHANDIQALLNRSFDTILIDVDSDPSLALHLVESLCVTSSTIVMVFSATADPELMLRGMRAGAREFFTLPFTDTALEKSLEWVASHRPAVHAENRPAGRLLVFFGSKGGVGVTTLAANFAVALAEESRQRTLLIDLNLNLGDAAMNLGLRTIHSTADALENAAQLDAVELAGLVAHHASGLSVLAAPLEMQRVRLTGVNVARLLAVALAHYDFVVVDAGRKVDLKQMHLFEESATAYLVTQVGIPELRNANRLIAAFSAENGPALEVVINRYHSRFLGLTDEHLSKALTRAPRWKVPNDFKAVREMQSSGAPFVHQQSALAAKVREMARDACGAGKPVQDAHHGSDRGFRLPWKAAPKDAPARDSAA